MDINDDWGHFVEIEINDQQQDISKINNNNNLNKKIVRNMSFTFINIITLLLKLIFKNEIKNIVNNMNIEWIIFIYIILVVKIIIK